MAVEALEKSKVDFSYEIIVVDNHSHDEESLMFLERAHHEKRIILIKSSKNIGFGRANNLGASQSSGKYVFFHNPDLTVHEDTLQKMVDYMEHHQDIAILGPKLMYSSGKVQDSCRRHMSFFDLVLNRTFLGRLPFFKSRVNKYLMEDFDHSKIQDVDLLTGAAMLMPKKVFDEVGGFDKRYFLFMEDFDLCQMVRKAGYRVVYYPEAVAEHYHKRLSRGHLLKLLTRKVFWHHIASAIRYFWKWRGARLRH